MIVKHTEAGWAIIYHYAHGLLAGQLAHHLRHDLRPARWVETLTAIIEHDDQQLDFSEKVSLSAVGAPRDFTQEDRTASYRLEHARRVVAAGLHKSGWIALLISMHLDFLNADLAEEHPGFAEFLSEQRTLRTTLRRRYGLNKARAEAIYQLLLFCDRCSLILCQDGVPALGRKLEINRTIDEETYFIWRSESGDLHVSPWCFAEDTFTVSVEQRTLRQLQFASDEDLRQALASAEVSVVEWTFRVPAEKS